MNNKVVSLCYVCGTKATVTEQGKGWCPSCLDICRHNRLAAKAQGRAVSLVGEAAKLMRERTNARILRVKDFDGDLLNRIIAEAQKDGLTLKEKVQQIFNAWLNREVK